MKKIIPLLGFLILIAWGCGKSEKKGEPQKASSTVKEVTQGNKKIVACVHGRPIYEEDLRGKPVEEFIVDEILYEEGLKRGLDKKFEERIEQYKKNLVINALKTEIIKAKPQKVASKEIEDYYEENESKYKYTRVMEISVEDKNLAEEIHKKALGGQDPEKIASDYSKPGKEVSVKDSGYSQIYNDIFSGKDIGTVSEVIQEGDKFKILKLVEVREIPLDKLNLPIKHQVIAKKRYEAVKEFVEELKKDNNIQVEIIEEEVKSKK